jgi:hypothetical protein
MKKETAQTLAVIATDLRHATAFSGYPPAESKFLRDIVRRIQRATIDGLPDVTALPRLGDVDAIESVEDAWKFWSELILKEDGTIDIDLLKKELSDFSMILHSYPIVLCHATGGRISKVNTLPSVIMSVIDDHITESVEGAVKEELEIRGELDGHPELIAGGLSVWYGKMPESNGRNNWTALLYSADKEECFTIDRSEYPHRVRYEADRMRHIIGETTTRPDILDYDADECTPCHLCGGSGEIQTGTDYSHKKPCPGLQFKGTVHSTGEPA